MALHWLVHLFLWCLSLATISSSSSTSSSMKCRRRCGKISIPYPFGMGDPICFRNKWFNVTCDESVTPPKAHLGHNFPWQKDFEVLDISLEGHLKTKKEIIHDCHSKSYNDSDGITVPISFYGSPYSYSNTRNKFTAVGCNTLAYMTGYKLTSSQIFRVGCISNCFGAASDMINGSYPCTGIGCCQTSIPPGIIGFQVNISRVSDLWISSCSYAFLVDQDFNLKFSVFNLSITSLLDRHKRVPVVLDWVASQNETCEAAIKNKTDYACLSENSRCNNSINGLGYLCSCSPGYQGNPYINGGCIDIDECKNKTSHNCKQMCINMPGSYHCKCQKGYRGDGWNNGTGCTADAKNLPVLKGTWGYLDPECFQTGKLTDNSDVYSFGVVLLELLTEEKAVCLKRSHEDRNLVMYFVREMKENRLFQLLEGRIRSEASVEQLMAIAQLALRCLKLNGEKRPTMKEVVVDLHGLRGFQNHLSIRDQETEKLLCETSQDCTEETGGQYSIRGHFDMSLTLSR